MDVSIIIPVFNKSELTRVCLKAIKREMPSSLNCEVIVVDNNSTDDTQAVLAEFPWITVLTNDVNRGFAGANNQAAAVCSGEFILLLNNDTEPQRGWLEPLVSVARSEGVGVVGARLLFPNRTLQHAGVVLQAARFGPYPLVPYHYLWKDPGTSRAAMQRRDFQIVTGACLLTPRKLYNELGGLDEIFWNGYEDVDYCFKVLARGLRVVYEPQGEIIHFESQSGVERFTRIPHNSTILTQRWADFPMIDHNHHYIEANTIRRWFRLHNNLGCASKRVPKTTAIVHGGDPPDPDALVTQICSTRAPLEKIIWAADVPIPASTRIRIEAAPGGALEALRTDMQVRGDRYIALIDGATQLRSQWLEELIEQVEWGTEIVAATVVQETTQPRAVAPLCADARCTLLSLRQFPQHEGLSDFETVDGAIADYLLRMLPYEFSTRSAAREIAILGQARTDKEFRAKYSADVQAFMRDDPPFLEAVLRERALLPGAGSKASIIMLSWNALQFTQIAIESIRAHTKMPYEIIIVDNGSQAETTDWLREQTGVTVIYNPTNRGFAKGCNQGIAAATGDYIVLLNNDVVVTDGWLENLVDALERDPATGVTAPRSNEIAGEQKLIEASYADLEGMHEMAARRTLDFRRSGYFTDRAIGFCLCIDRRVIEQIGGIDEEYGTGNFEDDDFCLRVRAAGYRIYVCDDVFIHHFGSVSFKTNQVDYMATMQRNWSKFAAKWGYRPEYPTHGYDPALAIRNGFDRAKHFVPLPPPPAVTQEGAETRRLLLMAVVADERDWGAIGSVARRYLSVFAATDAVAFAIACTGDLGAETIGARVERMVEKEGIDPAVCADVWITEETDIEGWQKSLHGTACYEVTGPAGPRLHGVETLQARGRGDLRRLYA